MVGSSSSSSSKQSAYALSDEDYAEWKRACTACQKEPNSVTPLETLANRPGLLNWRSPVSGQTLLHELAAKGAKAATLEAAVQLGCNREVLNAKGQTVDSLTEDTRPRNPAQSLRQAYSGSLDAELDLSDSPPYLAPPTRGKKLSSMMRPRKLAGRASTPSSSNAVLNSAPATLPPPAPSPSLSLGPRKAGKKLATYEVASVPKAQLNLNLDLMEDEDLDAGTLEKTIQQAYGGTARVQIDEINDEEAPTGAASSALASLRSNVVQRKQKCKARVLFDSESECKKASNANCSVQRSMAQSLRMNGEAIQFDGAAEVDSCDAMTLKLDSDSSHILCGACLLYNAEGKSEEVVCHNSQIGCAGAVQHSGDTQVDSKSVHTISLVMSKIPPEVTQVFFTICSCGPSDLSGFKNPSIMLYSNSQPDANLLEYSINQAAKSVSSVLARMTRRPVWSAGDRAVISRVLRKLRMPLLCLDLCLAMATESTFDIQALGTSEWHLSSKVCGQYHHAQQLIEERLRQGIPSNNSGAAPATATTAATAATPATAATAATSSPDSGSGGCCVA